MFCPNCSTDMSPLPPRDPTGGPYIFSHICADCQTLGGFDLPVSTLKGIVTYRFVFAVPADNVKIKEKSV